MRRDLYASIVAEARGRLDTLRETKGKEYTRGEEDILSNFKRTAQALGLGPLDVWGVYASKHWDAIMSFIKTEGHTFSTESIESRIDDLQVYLDLLRGLVFELRELKKRDDPFCGQQLDVVVADEPKHNHLYNENAQNQPIHKDCPACAKA